VIIHEFCTSLSHRSAGNFVELEAQNTAAIVGDGIVGILPQTLVARPFAPKSASVPVVIGLPALRPKPHAEMFARLLIEEARS
jgi:hypothetical protein